MRRARTVLGLSFALVVAAFWMSSGAPVVAHGGGLDAYGGHNDNKVGNYHAHQGSCAGRTFASKADAIRAGCRR
jgi:hypothetical protein